MDTYSTRRSRLPRRTARFTVLLGAGLLALLGGAPAAAGSGDQPGPGAGTLTAHLMRESALRTARADYLSGLAMCINLSDPEERTECIIENRQALLEAIDLAWEQFDARMELVDLLGDGPFDPEIDPEDFGPVITNPYRPMIPGTTMVYHAQTDEGLEETVVTVTGETKEVLGVECAVVRDTVSLDGELVEDTYDYFAQDGEGNLWYFGEIAMNFEDGELVDIEGSWQAGVDGAKPGLIAFAAPVVGTTYRQEFLLGEAEDVGQILDLAQTATVPYGTFTGCMQTRDWTPLEPGVFEQKYYAPGVGVVLEVDLETGVRTELVDVIVN